MKLAPAAPIWIGLAIAASTSAITVPGTKLPFLRRTSPTSTRVPGHSPRPEPQVLQSLAARGAPDQGAEDPFLSSQAGAICDGD